MKHKLKISVLKNPSGTGVVSYKKTSIREKVLKKLLGESRKIVILVPGDTVKDITIEEVQEVNEGGNE